MYIVLELLTSKLQLTFFQLLFLCVSTSNRKYFNQTQNLRSAMCLENNNKEIPISDTTHTADESNIDNQMQEATLSLPDVRLELEAVKTGKKIPSTLTLTGIIRRKQYMSRPGFTAKRNIRYFVQHNYHDMSTLSFDNLPFKIPNTFPYKLYSILGDERYSGIIRWQPHGRAFLIFKPKEFAREVMPHFFKHSKFTSFQRQLNLYGFERLTRGFDAGAYYNELFLCGRLDLISHMTRIRIKGTGYKAASNPIDEPEFYQMPFVRCRRTVRHAASSAVTGSSSTDEPKDTSLCSDDWHQFVQAMFENDKREKIIDDFQRSENYSIRNSYVTSVNKKLSSFQSSEFMNITKI